MLAAGLSLRSICQEPQMPSEACVRKWAFNDVQGFSTQYTHARDIGLDCLNDRLLEIAETPVIGEKRVQKADGSIEITTGDTVDRSRLAADTIKWRLSKMAPKKYGDRLAIAGDKENPLEVHTAGIEMLTARIDSLIARRAKSGTTPESDG